jgi:hypothetical protein
MPSQPVLSSLIEDSGCGRLAIQTVAHSIAEIVTVKKAAFFKAAAAKGHESYVYIKRVLKKLPADNTQEEIERLLQNNLEPTAISVAKIVDTTPTIKSNPGNVLCSWIDCY